MRQATARYFFRLKYHQGYYDACQDMAKALRSIRSTPHQKFVVQLIREWSEKALKEWDESPDKKDWRNDKPPRCNVKEVVKRARDVKDPTGRLTMPFVGEEDHEESFIGMMLGAVEED